MPHECLSSLWIARAEFLGAELLARWSIGSVNGWAKGLDDEDTFNALCALAELLREALDADDFNRVTYDHTGVYATGPIEELTALVSEELAAHRGDPQHSPAGAGWLVRVDGNHVEGPASDAAGRLYRRVREALDAGGALRAQG